MTDAARELFAARPTPAALVAAPQTQRDWASIADRAFSFLAGALVGVLVAVVLIMGVR